MRKSLFVASVAAIVAAASPGEAAVVFLDSITPEAGAYRFSYVVQFADGEGVVNGSNFSIFDFRGYVPGSITATAAGVAGVTELTSAGLQPVPGYSDDPSITNLRFTYNGPQADLSNQTFAGFSALSTLSGFGVDGFSGLSIKTTGALAGLNVFTQGPVGVPAAAVPEPAAWSLMLLGFAAIGSALRRRKVQVVFA